MKRGLRAAGWGLIGLLSFPVLVVLATNVFLRTDLLGRLANEDPDSLVVDFRGAASWFPGRLSFDSLTMRSRDHSVEFEAALEGVALRVSFPDLLGRRFHVTRVRARRLKFRLRERLRREEATPTRLARYPRIEGFADPSLLQPTPSGPVRGTTSGRSCRAAPSYGENSAAWPSFRRTQVVLVFPAARVRFVSGSA